MFIKNIINKSSLRYPKLNSSSLVLFVPIDSMNTCQDVAGQLLSVYLESLPDHNNNVPIMIRCVCGDLEMASIKNLSTVNGAISVLVGGVAILGHRSALP